jgi:hypothetical protein
MSLRYALSLACLWTLLVSAPTQAADVNLSPTADVRILSFFPDTNEGLGSLLSVWTQPGNIQRTLMQFDLGGIPAGQQIDSAILTLFVHEQYGDDNPSNLNMDIHAVTAPWNELQVTWNSAATGTPWATPGGDFAALVYATSTANAPSFAPITWDVTDLVGEWYDGSLDNHGLLLQSFLGNGLTFYSGNSPSAAQYHPYLTVSHSAIIPEPSSVVLMAVGLLALVGVAHRRRRARTAD